jgi:TonB-linked SusC/RagA family outer membrane protein
MLKTALCGWPARGGTRHLTKTLLVMKLTVFLLTAAFLNVSAKGVSQNVTFSGQDVPLEKVFAVVKQQTGYLFLYSENTLNHSQPVTLAVTNMPLLQFLEHLFAHQPLKYSIESRTINVTAATPRDEKKRKAPPFSNDTSPITGVVRGPDGQPLAGANVFIKGSTKGVVTDANGHFTIDAENGSTLVISNSGYAPKELKVGNENNLLIDLEISISKLDEVQIIAYGTQTRRYSVGNVASVKAEDIEKQPVQNPLVALQGRVPGVFITQNSGVPGGGVTVRIQGQNSIENGNDPLYVVDGVPINSQLPSTINGAIRGGSGGANNAYGNPLSYINLTDIESIEVLKDADATSIYGSRAANGAILITTKTGKATDMKLDVNIQQGISYVGKFPQMLNTQQYLAMRKEAFKNDGLSLPDINITPTDNNYDINGFWDTTRYTDWQRELIGGKAKYTNVNAGISGGNNFTQYSLRGTYSRQTTVYPGDFSDQRAAFSANISSSSLNQKFKMQFVANYLKDNNHLPSTDFVYSSMSLAPDAPELYNSDKTINWAFNSEGVETWLNPMAALADKYLSKTENLISKLDIGCQLSADLNIKTTFGYTQLKTNDLQTSTLAATRPGLRSFYPRSAYYSQTEENNWTIEPQINYHKHIGNSDVSLLLGTTVLENSTNAQSVFGSGHGSDELLVDQSAAATLTPQASINLTYRYYALFGRGEYNLNNKYLFNASVRRDGSSRFGPDSRFHTFWSVGAGWILTEEDWARPLTNILSFAKFRASYGTTGSDQIPDYYFMDLYNLAYAGVNYQGVLSTSLSRLYNPYLQWEETRKMQAGFDLGFFKDRLLFNITYQRNRSSNQLLNYQLPEVTGFGSVASNFPATVQNSSLELSSSLDLIKTKRFVWSASTNFTIPKNQLVAFPGIDSSSYSNQYIVGKSLSTRMLVHSLGVDPNSGEYSFADKDGKQVLVPDLFNDRVSYIDIAPKYYGGMQQSFTYAGFQLQVFFQYVKQMAFSYAIYNGLGYPGNYFTRFFYNQPVTVLDRWQKPGDESSVAKFSTIQRLSDAYTAGNSDYMYRDASYVKLKNASLSWQVSAKWMKSIAIKNAKIFIEGQNLLTITKYRGVDPESQGFTSLPPLKVWVAGFNVTF